MYWVLVWEIGPANNTTRWSGLSKRRLPHAWHLSQLAINLKIFLTFTDSLKHKEQTSTE